MSYIYKKIFLREILYKTIYLVTKNDVKLDKKLMDRLKEADTQQCRF